MINTLFKYILNIRFLFFANDSLAQNSNFTPVTAKMIQERLSVSEVVNIHPRLFFSQDDIHRIRKLNEQGDTLIHI